MEPQQILCQYFALRRLYHTRIQAAIDSGEAWPAIVWACSSAGRWNVRQPMLSARCPAALGMSDTFSLMKKRGVQFTAFPGCLQVATVRQLQKIRRKT